MTLSDLLDQVSNIVITDEYIEEMTKCLDQAAQQFEKESKEKQPTWDWYHKIVG